MYKCSPLAHIICNHEQDCRNGRHRYKSCIRHQNYKYKDKIFIASKGYGRRAIVSLKTADEKGVLSGIVSEVYAFNGNVISINQAAPINGVAVITLSVDLAETEIEVGDLIERLKKIEFVKSASIVAIE